MPIVHLTCCTEFGPKSNRGIEVVLPRLLGALVHL